MNLNYQMDIIPHRIFKFVLSRFKKNMGKVEGGNNSESLLNEIRQTVHCLHLSKQITKKVYKSIIKSI